MFSIIKKSRGQVILIILLVTAVGLTLGLSLVSRAISDVKISTQIAESQRAFSAAESGIESALKGAAVTGGGGTVNLSGASANYNVAALGGNGNPYTIPNVAAGNSQTVWLVDHQADGTLYPTPTPLYKANSVDICWGPTSGNPDPNPAAVEMTLLYISGGTYKIGKAAYDPAPGMGGHCSQCSMPLKDMGMGSCNSNKKYWAQITNIKTTFGADPTVDTLLLFRLNPIYASTDLVVYPPSGTILATQGKNISSTGTTTAGVARKLNVLQGFASLPPAFDYTFFTNQ